MMPVTPGRFDPELAKNLRAVYGGVARAFKQGSQVLGGPPMLSEGDVWEAIPELLFDIAREAGWILAADEFLEREVLEEMWRSADPFTPRLNDFNEDYRTWFLEHFRDVLERFSGEAARNEKKRTEFISNIQLASLEVLAQRSGTMLWRAGHAKGIIDSYMKLSKTVHTLTALAKEACTFKADGGSYPVTRVQISRIYNDLGNVSLEIRKAVAAAISQDIPCTPDDLLPPD